MAEHARVRASSPASRHDHVSVHDPLNVSTGSRKPKDVAKILSMDKKAVENETNIRRGNGYLTKDNRLTTKGLNILS